jgi:RimJ/RimL family protein N-acetyltransferase
MILRPATVADSHDLWQWRNDQDTRKASRNVEHIPWAVHTAWIEHVLAGGLGALTGDRTRLMVAEVDGKPIGTVRIDHHNATGEDEISWTIAPAERGKGYATEMVKLAIARHGGRLVADIKPGNKASLQVARKSGFSKVGEHDMFEKWRR